MASAKLEYQAGSAYVPSSINADVDVLTAVMTDIHSARMGRGKGAGRGAALRSLSERHFRGNAAPTAGGHPGQACGASPHALSPYVVPFKVTFDADWAAACGARSTSDSNSGATHTTPKGRLEAFCIM